MRSTEQPRTIVFADAPWLLSAGFAAGGSGFLAAAGEPVGNNWCVFNRHSGIAILLSLVLTLWQWLVAKRFPLHQGFPTSPRAGCNGAKTVER